MFRRLRRNAVLVLRFPAHVSFGPLDPFQNLSLHHSTLIRKLLFPKSQKILSALHSTFQPTQLFIPSQPNSPNPTHRRSNRPHSAKPTLSAPSPSVPQNPFHQTDGESLLSVGLAESVIGIQHPTCKIQHASAQLLSSTSSRADTTDSGRSTSRKSPSNRGFLFSAANDPMARTPSSRIAFSAFSLAKNWICACSRMS